MFTKDNMSKAVKAVLVLLPFICASYANAAGFALYEFSARGNAMGGSVIANKAEPASLATNPALITQLEGTQVQVGATYVSATSKTTVNGDKRELESDFFVLPNFYATYQAHEHIYLGLAGFSRFGLGGKYKDYKSWGAAADAYTVGVESFSFTPVIAVKATPEISVSMGLEAMILSFQEEKYGYVAPGTNTKISGSNVAWGGGFGLHYKPEWAEKWGFGASYRTKMRQVINGRVKTTAGNNIINAASYNAQGNVTLPDMIMTGVSFQPDNKWVFEAGMTYTFWSSYDAIRITNTQTTAPSTGTSVDTKNYKDTPRFNIGAEYMINQNWAVRGGYVYDISPINTKHMDTLVPVDDRHIFNIGAGYENDKWGVDASYSYLMAKDLTGYNVELGKSLKYEDASSHLIGLTFKYKFDSPMAHKH
ncbi:long-chain fatty acid transport protein [Elusimicrobium posterum]|uniref:OmpP1/FadL family transporter n=1 Tax=Elusimicrobium posterum TaxID=3116653 RepID=UPI003C773362